MPKSLNGLLDEIEAKIDSFIQVYRGEKLNWESTKLLLEINIDKYKIENEINKYGKKEVISSVKSIISKIDLLITDQQNIYIIAKNITQGAFLAYGYVNTTKVEYVLLFYRKFLNTILEILFQYLLLLRSLQE